MSRLMYLVVGKGLETAEARRCGGADALGGGRVDWEAARRRWKEEGDLSEPADLGIPLPQWRPVQLYALMEALNSDKKVIVLNAPTGSGKTAIAAAFVTLFAGRGIYTAHSKDLQDQAERDIPYSRVLKGRRNYPTLDYPGLFPEVSCEDCDKHAWGDCPLCRRLPAPDGRLPKHCTSCSAVGLCPYEQAKAEALAAPLAVANNAHLLVEANRIGRLSGWPVIVLDEGDLLESVLMDYVAVVFSQRLLAEMGIPAPAFKGATATAAGQERKREEWGGWLQAQVIPALTRTVESLESQCAQRLRAGDLRGYRQARRRYQHLDRLRAECAVMLEDLRSAPASWVRVDDNRGALVFKPIHIGRHAMDLLWKHSEKFLVMSATVISHVQFCRDLGLDRADVEFIDLPCTFPVANRPLIYLPAASVTRAHMDAALPLLVSRVDAIIQAYPGVRILIHTHTYDIARYLLTHAANRARMISYERDDAPGRQRTLDDYRRRPDAVLVAPSLERGISFPDDLCRCQVLVKTPFPSLGDRQVSQRFHAGADGKTWYYVQTVRSLVQMTGRAVRSETDWAHTYIVDSEFGRFYRQHRPLFPDWWRDAVDMTTQRIRGLAGMGVTRAGVAGYR
jgi:ATP-dependent DNA helicase DinG